MTYRLAGISTELCSCDAPCPCAFGQKPTGGTCRGVFAFEIQEGELDGLSLAGTKAVLASEFNGVWTGGNFTAALILDANASEEQRNALTRIFGGDFGGDAGGLAELIGDMKGVFVAPIEYQRSGGNISVKAGDVLDGAGATLKNLDGSAEIEVKATKVKVNVEGLRFEHDGSGMWTGPFELQG
jgi:hypothetical protein